MTIVLSSSSSSSFGINNYGDLKEKTALWLNRTNLTDSLPDFVRLAETTIRRDVRTRVQEIYLSDTATDATIPSPDLLLDVRRLVVAGRRKTYITPDDYADLDAASSQADHFTIIGESIYVLGGTTGAAYTMLYWKAFEAFVEDTDSNWLLQNAPEVYLWASCKEGAEFLKDFEAADRFQGKYNAAAAALNSSEKNMRYSGSSMVVRPAGSTP